SVSLNGLGLQVRTSGPGTTVFTVPTQVLGRFGSGSEYLQVFLPSNALPNGGAQVRLRSGTTTIDRATYPGNVNNGQTWARFKDPVTGVPIDTQNNADFYVSSSPSAGGADDRHGPTIVVTRTGNLAVPAPGNGIPFTLHSDNTDTGLASAG